MSETETKNDECIGKRYGRLTVIALEKDEVRYESKGKSRPHCPVRHRMYRCLCDCGNETVVDYKHLKSGRIQSCGCLNREVTSNRSVSHGLFKDNSITKALYTNVYTSMIRRCYNPNDRSYRNCGALGIKVAPEWYTPGSADGFKRFAEWALAAGYRIEKNEHGINRVTLDRIDISKDFTADNCRWVMLDTKGANRRNNVYYEDSDGEILTRAKIGNKHNYSDPSIIDLERSGWSHDAIVYKLNHPELRLRRAKGGSGYETIDGYTVMIPTLARQ